MSGWDSWVNCLTMKRRISTGGIFGHNGEKYAATANFQADAKELAAIISSLSSYDTQPFTSFTLYNKKFMVITNVNGVIVGKVDKNIAAIGLGKTTCVVGIYMDGADPGITSEPRAPDVLSDVAEIVDHLMKSGY